MRTVVFFGFGILGDAVTYGAYHHPPIVIHFGAAILLAAMVMDVMEFIVRITSKDVPR